MSGKSTKKEEVVDLINDSDDSDDDNNNNKERKKEIIDLINTNNDNDNDNDNNKQQANNKKGDVIIDLVDDDDDDGNKEESKKPAAKIEPSSIGRVHVERQQQQQQQQQEGGSSNNNKRQKVETEQLLPEVDNNDTGCMLRPKNPIKIFATDRDILRRTNTNSSNSTTLDQNILQHCYSFREMLGLDRFQQTISKDGIDWIFITTFVLDMGFLLEEIPELSEISTVIICYQHMRSHTAEEERRWIEQGPRMGKHRCTQKLNPKGTPKSNINPLKASFEYGTHHTKMVLTGYSSGRLRVNIHTSNLQYEDIHHKTQGAFIQDFMPKSEDDFFSSSPFGETLNAYLDSYKLETKYDWKPGNNNNFGPPATLGAHLELYDYSTAVGILIPSVPGYHKLRGTNATGKMYGYLKVQQAIRENCQGYTSDNGRGGDGDLSKSPIVCQFSSIGSLYEAYLDKLATAWNACTCDDELGNDAALSLLSSSKSPSSSTSKRSSGGSNKKKIDTKGLMSSKLLRFVWPTVEEITTSVEGLVGGSSVPGQPKNLGRDFIQSKLHRWKSTNSSINGGGDGNPLDKGKHVPHIKTYYQIDNNDNDTENEESMRWFVISSHNLSKPAWGEIQNREGEDKLTIQSWELGVFVSPKTLGVDSMGPILSSTNVNNEGYTLGRNSSASLFPPNQQQQLMREQRLARFGGNGTPQQLPQPQVVSSSVSLPPPPPEDNSKPRATTDKRAATAAPIINQNNKQQRSRSIIPIPYKFLPDKYTSSDQSWDVSFGKKMS